MTDQELKELITKIKAETPTTAKVKSPIDTAFSFIPVGWKTIIGVVGSLASGGAVNSGAIDSSTINHLLDVAMYVFVGLGGLGLVAKYDRQILVTKQVLDTLASILGQLDAKARESGNIRDA